MLHVSGNRLRRSARSCRALARVECHESGKATPTTE